MKLKNCKAALLSQRHRLHLSHHLPLVPFCERDVTGKELENTFKAMTMERLLEKHFAKQGWLTLLPLQISAAERICFLFLPRN